MRDGLTKCDGVWPFYDWWTPVTPGSYSYLFQMSFVFTCFLSRGTWISMHPFLKFPGMSRLRTLISDFNIISAIDSIDDYLEFETVIRTFYEWISCVIKRVIEKNNLMYRTHDAILTNFDVVIVNSDITSLKIQNWLHEKIVEKGKFFCPVSIPLNLLELWVLKYYIPKLRQNSFFSSL